MVKLTTANWDNFVHTFPQIERQFIGFDRVFDFLTRDFEPIGPNFPPFNIQKLDDYNFEIQIALAGFKESDLSVEAKDNTLTITGDQLQGAVDGEPENFIHKGIAERKFTRTWSLADTVVVKGAKLKDGVLRVSLENKIPEEKKARQIEIKTK